MKTEKSKLKNKEANASEEQVFRLMFERHSAIMLFVEPQTGAILDANRAAVEFYGYPKTKLCSMLINEINTMPPDQVEVEYKKALHEERNYFIFTHRLASGEKRIVEVHSSPIALKKKTVLFSIIHDITIRKKEEGIMRMGEVRYKAIFENAPVGIFQSTPQGQFQRVNPSMVNIYGYDSPMEMVEDITNISSQVYVNASDRLALQSKLAAHGEVMEFVSEEYRKDGSTIWTQTSARAEKDEYGNILFYEGFITDITARKLAEDALRKAHDELEQRVAQRTEELTRVNTELRMEIAERKQAEAALRDSEEKLRSIIEYATNGITLTDEHGNVTEWNTAQSQIIGLTRGAVIGRPLWDVQFQSMLPERRAPEVYEKIRGLFRHMLTTGEIPEHVREQEIKLLRPNGDAQFIHSVVFSIKTTQGFRLAGISHDISERKQAEMARQEALDRLQKIASRVPGVVYQYRLRPDGSSCFPFASEALNEIYRVCPGEVREDASKVFEKLHPDDVDGVIASIQKSAKELTPWKQEYRVKFEDGTIQHLYGNSIPELEEDGSVLWHGFIADITDRKELEKELQTQRDFATQIINVMGQGLTVTNAEGCFEFVNPAYARLFGYETSNLIGKHPEDVTVQEDHEMLSEQRIARKNGETTSYESKLRRKDGSTAHVLVTGVPRERNGYYEGAIAVVTDLTAQKHIEEELRRTRDELVILHSELEKSYALEKQAARIDSLTGINNRRSLFEFAERELNVAIRYHQPLSMILFDIDRFKQINDNYGHLMGDQLLTHIAQTVMAELRSVDVIGRYGGDEFIILLPQTNSQSAFLIAERIHTKVSTIQIEFDTIPITVTVSVGITQVATNKGQPETVENVILRADKALYAAKQSEQDHTVIIDAE